VRVLHASVGLERRRPPHEIRYTADGSMPGPGGSLYRGPVPAIEKFHAAVLVGGRTVASLGLGEKRFRPPPSAPPERRESFER
jgi:hypothetical protein